MEEGMECWRDLVLVGWRRFWNDGALDSRTDNTFPVSSV